MCSLLNLCFKGEQVPYGPQDIETVSKVDIHNRLVRDSEGKVIYEQVKIGEKTTLYKKNTIGKVLGFKRENYNGFYTNGINNLENPLIFKANEITKDTKTFNQIPPNTYILIKEKTNGFEYTQRFKIKNIVDHFSNFRIC